AMAKHASLRNGPDQRAAFIANLEKHFLHLLLRNEQAAQAIEDSYNPVRIQAAISMIQGGQDTGGGEALLKELKERHQIDWKSKEGRETAGKILERALRLGERRDRSELRVAFTQSHVSIKTPSAKGNLLIDADDFGRLSDAEREELLKTLYANRSETRLVIYNERGQIPESALTDGILKSPNVFRSSGNAETALTKFGIPGAFAVHFSKEGRAQDPHGEFRREARRRVKFFKLKEQPGVIAVAVLYARSELRLAGMTEKDGFIEPPQELLDLVQARYLSQQVIGVAA
ncbi:MAG: hypothetical protein PHS88_09535, partial [Candidatus Omnitrophica bacterium]|nr:hypothetical protein [Candidatus Omnitrophota bacterium]